jgi:hypothetical protein
MSPCSSVLGAFILKLFWMYWTKFKNNSWA